MRSSSNAFARGTRRAEPDENRGTLVAPGGNRSPMFEPAAAFAAFVGALRGCARQQRDRILVAISEDGRACRHLLLAPGEVAIIGRHSRCDLRLSDPSLSLRHLAVAVSSDSNAADPFVRIWDLATGEPFATEDGVLTRAVTSTGPCFLGLPGVAIAIVPLSALPAELPLGTRALWESLPERAIVAQPGQHEAKPETRRAQTITRVRGAVEVSRVGCDPELATGTLSVFGDGAATTYFTGENDLARGVLIGRYGRCISCVSADSVSRVHLLIARVGAELVAVDTASTNGSAMSRRGDFRAARLDGDALIALADSLVVKWQPRPRGSA